MPSVENNMNKYINKLVRKFKRRFLDSNSKYWDSRYESGGDSGMGSFGKLAEYKANFLNRFVEKNVINSIVEIGCGDGNQLKLYRFPAYLGLDISPTAISKCKAAFSGDKFKKFVEFQSKLGFCAKHRIKGDLALSIDVIFHLIIDEHYYTYLDELFSCSNQWVIIYSSNSDDAPPASHVRHRIFVDDIYKRFPGWQLHVTEQNPYPFKGNSETGSFADFFVFKREEKA